MMSLQRGDLDCADWLFANLEKSLSHALDDNSDVRECVPEPFFLPEMFLNLNWVKFGTTQLGEEVNDVKLPEWAKGDPFYYTYVLRWMIESDYASSQLHLWIDYIFGHKQQGKEAEKSLNVFPYITYENKVSLDVWDPKANVGADIAEQERQEMILPLLSWAYNYGQTPLQLFKEPHWKKLEKPVKFNLITDENSQLKTYTSTG